MTEESRPCCTRKMSISYIPFLFDRYFNGYQWFTWFSAGINCIASNYKWLTEHIHLIVVSENINGNESLDWWLGVL